MSIKEIARMENYLLPGSAACPGCGLQLNLKLVLKALGRRTVMITPASCSSVVQGPYPRSSFKVIVINTAFETAASLSVGVSAALRIKGIRDVTVLAWAGDGGTFDIGLQALSSAAEKNENILYICYDNESYMNTGIQASGATPYGAWTTTTPTGKKQHKKDILGIMYSHGIPYIASANPAFPIDLTWKIRKAKKIEGTRFIHLFSPCPPGWRVSPRLTIKLGKLAVETGMWILYEVENGEFRFTGLSKLIADGKLERKPLREYLNLQGRFKNLRDKDIAELDKWVELNWERLKGYLK